MNQVYYSTTTNPYDNIAFEKKLVDTEFDNVLFLWQNDKTVVIGRNQNALSECNLQFLEEHNITLARRFSGGGAVYHDLGNINYTLVQKTNEFNIEKIQEFLTDALEKLGFKIEFSGKNDMLINHKKFSGHAYFFERDRVVFHGTLMVDLDISMLTKALSPSKVKLEAKGIKSVRSRVTNLNEVKPDVTINNIKCSLVDSFIKYFGEIKSIKRIGEHDIDKNIYHKISNKEWLFGEAPRFELQIEKRLSFGMMKIHLNIRSNKITKAKIYTDSLQVDWKELEDSLINMEFIEADIWDKVRSSYKSI